MWQNDASCPMHHWSAQNFAWRLGVAWLMETKCTGLSSNEGYNKIFWNLACQICLILWHDIKQIRCLHWRYISFARNNWNMIAKQIVIRSFQIQVKKIRVKRAKYDTPVKYLFLFLTNKTKSEGRLNIKMLSYQYRDPNVKDKTWPSYL